MKGRTVAGIIIAACTAAGIITCKGSGGDRYNDPTPYPLNTRPVTETPRSNSMAPPRHQLPHDGAAERTPIPPPSSNVTSRKSFSLNGQNLL